MSNLLNILKEKIEKRDEAWEKKFLKELPTAFVTVVGAEPQRGPDGWPYLFATINLEPSHSRDNASEPISGVLNWLSTRGIGLVLNPDGPAPDFVLTYGMIWNFRERGEFLSEIKSESSESSELNEANGPAQNSSSGKLIGTDKMPVGDFRLKSGQQVMTYPPTAAELPEYTRAIIKQFLLDQGVFAPKVLKVSFDLKNYDFCFSIESLNSPPQTERSGIAEALAWFFPAHYVIGLVSESAVPGFVSL